MYRRSLVSALLLLANGRFRGPIIARARQTGGTPGAEPPAEPPAEPQVVMVDASPRYLAVQTVPELPAAPVTVALRRLTLTPGDEAVLAGPPDSVSLIVLEAGAVVMRAGYPLAATRGGPGGVWDEAAAGADLALAVGDFLIGPGQGAVEVESATDGDSSMLIFAIEPALASTLVPATTPDLVEPATLAEGDTGAVPTAPALLEIIRFDLQPGGYVRLPDANPATALILVEAGEMSVTMDAPAVVRRATPNHPAAAPVEYAANIEFTVGAGESMIGPPSAKVLARNAGGTALTILMAVMQPAPAA